MTTFTLRTILATRGITQDKIAAAAGCAQSTVSLVLSGRPTSSRIRDAVARAAGIEPRVFEDLLPKGRSNG